MNTLIQKAMQLGISKENAKILYDLFGDAPFSELMTVKQAMRRANKADEQTISQDLYNLLKSELGEAFANRVLKLLDTDDNPKNNIVKLTDNTGMGKSTKASDELLALLIAEYGEEMAQEAIALLDNNPTDDSEETDETNNPDDMEEKAIQRFEFWADYLESTPDTIATTKGIKRLRQAEAKQNSIQTEYDFWKDDLE